LCVWERRGGGGGLEVGWAAGKRGANACMQACCHCGCAIYRCTASCLPAAEPPAGSLNVTWASSTASAPAPLYRRCSERRGPTPTPAAAAAGAAPSLATGASLSSAAGRPDGSSCGSDSRCRLAAAAAGSAATTGNPRVLRWLLASSTEQNEGHLAAGLIASSSAYGAHGRPGNASSHPACRGGAERAAVPGELLPWRPPPLLASPAELPAGGALPFTRTPAFPEGAVRCFLASFCGLSSGCLRLVGGLTGAGALPGQACCLPPAACLLGRPVRQTLCGAGCSPPLRCV
jgi:hypothetical protein